MGHLNLSVNEHCGDTVGSSGTAVAQDDNDMWPSGPRRALPLYTRPAAALMGLHTTASPWRRDLSRSTAASPKLIMAMSSRPRAAFNDHSYQKTFASSKAAAGGPLLGTKKGTTTWTALTAHVNGGPVSGSRNGTHFWGHEMKQKLYDWRKTRRGTVAARRVRW